MAEPKRIKDNTAIPAPAGDDVTVIIDISTDIDHKITLTALKAWILESRALGGWQSRDIVDIDTEQILSHKRWETPLVNEGVNELESTSSELNSLHGFTGDVSDLELTHTYKDYIPLIGTLTSNAQTQLNALSILINNALASRTYHYSVVLSSGITSYARTAAQIIAAAGVPSGYGIVPHSIVETLSTKSGGTYTRISASGGGETPAAPQLTWTETTASGIYVLDTATWSNLDSGTQYVLSITFRIVSIVSET